MTNAVLCLLLMAGHLLSVCGDVYLHSPRGSNNRLLESSRNRNNANRLFDSQNNARGGYNAGSLYYYVNSRLPIEWTNQHSCGDVNNNCEIIIQYMCSDYLRDGTTQATIPENPKQCKDGNCDTDLAYGMHEDYYYYAGCKLRRRNGGLFISDRKLNGQSAKYTRQNNQGTRRGYECPEERDYYPYWHPTPWKDIAVLTNDVSRCEYYQKESQNVKSRFYCDVPYQHLWKNANENVEVYIPIEKEECETFEADGPVEGEKVKGVWREHKAHGLPPPTCGNNFPTRDNHLGNSIGGYPATFNWTIFDDPNQRCAMRIRYNISTGEFGWNATSQLNSRNLKPSMGPDIWTELGLTAAEAKSRQYYLRNNPEVQVFDTTKFTLALAMNTAQYGRTFEDRSHRFTIKSRDESLKGVEIDNVNVVGKRGNIVQVYPGVEYDFVPRVLRVAKNSHVHFQWTGSNTNNNQNDGQGRAGTDRSNVVPMNLRSYAEGDPTNAARYTFGHAGVAYPRNVIQANFLGFTDETKMMLASLYNVQFGGDMEELDDAGTYYDIGPRKVTMTGDFNYMCTRNNNFSNRSQKGKIVVKEGPMTQKYMGQFGGNLTVTGSENTDQTGVYIPPQTLTAPQLVAIEVIPEHELTLTSRPPNKDYVSHFVHLSNEVQVPSDNPIIFTIQLKNGVAVGSLYRPTVYRTRDDSSWVGIAVHEASSAAVSFRSDAGGHFVVSKEVDPGPMAGLVIGMILVVVLIGVAIYYCRNSKLPLAGYKSKV